MCILRSLHDVLVQYLLSLNVVNITGGFYGFYKRRQARSTFTIRQPCATPSIHSLIFYVHYHFTSVIFYKTLPFTYSAPVLFSTVL